MYNFLLYVMATAMEVDSAPATDEGWLVWRARQCLKTDPYATKAWLITAKTLFPRNFNIQVLITGQLVSEKFTKVNKMTILGVSEVHTEQKLNKRQFNLELTLPAAL